MDSPVNFVENLYKFVVSNVPADAPALLSARSSAGIVVIKV